MKPHPFALLNHFTVPFIDPLIAKPPRVSSSSFRKRCKPAGGRTPPDKSRGGPIRPESARPYPYSQVSQATTRAENREFRAESSTNASGPDRGPRGSGGAGAPSPPATARFGREPQ